MNGLRIEIELAQPLGPPPLARKACPPASPSSVWQPGEKLEGEFHIANCTERSTRAAECSVLWYTVGKGDEDLHVHALRRFELEDRRTSDSSCSRSFSFDLPASPKSYDGVIVKIRWSVRVRVFLSGGQEVVSETPIALGTTHAVRLAEPISEMIL